MAQVRIIKAHDREVEVSSGDMTRLAGVSAGLVGAQGIHLALAIIPPGRRSSPHWHTNCESAIYISRGRGRFLAGEDLQTELEFESGDFIYVPQDALHQPVNDGTEPVEMVVARNTPVELVQEYTGPAGLRVGQGPYAAESGVTQGRYLATLAGWNLMGAAQGIKHRTHWRGRLAQLVRAQS